MDLKYRGYLVWKVVSGGEAWWIAATTLDAATACGRGDDVSGCDADVRAQIRTARWLPVDMDYTVRTDCGDKPRVTLRECIDEELEHDAPRDAFLVGSTLF